MGEFASPTPTLATSLRLLTGWPPCSAQSKLQHQIWYGSGWRKPRIRDHVSTRHIAGARVVRHADGALFASDALAPATLARMSPPELRGRSASRSARTCSIHGEEPVFPDSDSCYDHAHVNSLQSASSRQSFPNGQGGRLQNIIWRAKCRIWPGRAHAQAPSFKFPFYIHAPGVTASVLTQMVKTCVALYSCPER